MKRRDAGHRRGGGRGGGAGGAVVGFRWMLATEGEQEGEEQDSLIHRFHRLH